MKPGGVMWVTKVEQVIQSKVKFIGSNEEFHCNAIRPAEIDRGRGVRDPHTRQTLATRAAASTRT